MVWVIYHIIQAYFTGDEAILNTSKQSPGTDDIATIKQSTKWVHILKQQLEIYVYIFINVYIRFAKNTHVFLSNSLESAISWRPSIFAPEREGLPHDLTSASSILCWVLYSYLDLVSGSHTLPPRSRGISNPRELIFYIVMKWQQEPHVKLQNKTRIPLYNLAVTNFATSYGNGS